MKIPKSFFLHGQKIKVVWDRELVDKTDNTGEAHYRSNQIYIHALTKGNKYRTSTTLPEQVFFHELVHFILHHMGEDERKKDEKFTDTFAHLLHQALTTAEY